MKYSPKNLLLSAFCLWLGACAATPPMQAMPPGEPAPSYALGRAPDVAASSARQVPLDEEKSIVYRQEAGGLPFLPGLINAPFIAWRTAREAEQLRGKLDLKPREIFPEVAKNEKFTLAADENEANTRITPYLQFSRLDDNQLAVASVLVVERRQGETPWTGKYLYQLSGQYSFESLAKLDLLGMYQIYGLAVEGYAKLLRHLAAEGGEGGSKETDILFSSEVAAPGAGEATPGRLILEDGNVVWIRTPDGVFALRKAGVSYTQPGS